MNFARLERFKAQFDRVLIYPKDWEEVRSLERLQRGSYVMALVN
jgi:hypothetical protein